MDEVQYTGDEVLEIMSRYAPNRNQGIERLIRDAFNLEQGGVLMEFGAGKGEFIDRFQKMPGLETQVVELEPTYLADLGKRHQAFASLEEVPDTSVDFLYLIDVLEHLEDDQDFLLRFHAKLKPGGRILIYVPARRELFSEFDRSIGHFRRYHLLELKQKLIQADFRIEHLRYHEFLGYFVAWYNPLFAHSGKLNAGAVAFYDRYLLPVTAWMETWAAPPIGKSLYVIGIKP